ncbi:glycoside hydrolase family 43 protein [Oceanispirochaeta sp.]|uniref:glycoside hydrolase family 43 protein n=1 Tax=Oceanispirochaeta sp. TaxID=2035350 RepID=UPI0026379465|nr:glycoside hydrolase family 43 protein [Oceanispirochaeta sp.]MDA3956255.1 glycoside hydrolase family 43 protein [Oceanispirochaeta sp.]
MIHRKNLQIRDPFIVPVISEDRYYLFGTTDENPWNQPGVGFNAYSSTDLENFEGPYQVFSPSGGFWGTHDFWAPELHIYQGRFYLFATFTSDSCRRGTQILVSDSILGPFEPLINGAVTPDGWECLDGTLFIDLQGFPWMVFCHEWVQAHDGGIYAMPLSSDLSHATGELQLLFKASAALWPKTLERRDGSGLSDARVTDGPFLHLQADGRLVMLWSSLGQQGYAMGCAVSDSGLITGPWRQNHTPLISLDGGHGMVFKDFSGKLQLTYHTPNKTPLERFVFQEVKESADGLIPVHIREKV